MAAQRDRKGQISVQVWIDRRIHRKAKARLVLEGKVMRDEITKFLAWYGGIEDEEDEGKKTSETG